ncbi:hypothetical protein [Micromonospora nigra]|uniref:hypothetical protein n=1 Tax=Micromonospora nigra TaxID=145857 RepID=UPI001112DEFF|nr:hypothetical protein [Micromonospora nigra]
MADSFYPAEQFQATAATTGGEANLRLRACEADKSFLSMIFHNVRCKDHRLGGLASVVEVSHRLNGWFGSVGRSWAAPGLVVVPWP